MPRRLRGAGPSPCIGVLVDCLDDSGYQSAILGGAVAAARASGAHLLCFGCGVLDGEPGEGRERNFLVDWARPTNVDGLVVLAGSVGKRVGAERLGARCQTLGRMPVCGVAAEMEGISSVCIDNGSGMRVALEHLVRVHGLRRIAFVRGPESNDEAERRYAVYREVLRAEGLAFDEQLVAPGTFEPVSGREAVQLLLDTRRLAAESIEALVAANDSMALAAMDALQRRGVRIPEQIAVVGFDDVDEARLALPPLSTVHQPLSEQGRDAVRVVLDQLRTGVLVERLSRPTELVTRRSCGCLALGSRGPSRDEDAAPGLRLGFEASMVRNRQVILAELARAARGELAAAGGGWNERLLNAFVGHARSGDPDGFVRAYDEFLRKLEASPVDLTICLDVLTTLRTLTLRGFGDDAPRRARAEDLFHDALSLTAHVLERREAGRRLAAVRLSRALGHALAAIASSRDRVELSRALHDHLPGLGICRSFVIECSPESTGPAARVALADVPGGGPSIAEPAAPFVPVSQVLRDGLLPGDQESAFAVLPIGGERPSAVVALELGAANYAYESLRNVLSATWERLR